MDLKYTPEEEAFRQELRSWLEANLPKDYDPDDWEWALPAEERFRLQLEWHKKLHAGGWVGVHWPREYGGRGATLVEQAIYAEEMERYQAPPGVNLLGILLVGPTLMHWGTEEQKKRFIPKILSAEEIWCQGFSEPGAGSDLASLACRAVEDGDDFVINGQKVWTSYAHLSDWCILLVRTDPNVPKHKGISYLLADMHSPGVTIRPLVQITGEADFNEVFFDEVRIPKKNLVGQKNMGWQVAITTLMYERSGIGFGSRLDHTLEQLVELARRVERNGQPAAQDSAVRQQLAQFAIEIEAIKFVSLRQLTQQLKGAPPGPEGSITKLAASELGLRMMFFATELLGPYGQLAQDSKYAIDRGRWLRHALAARGMTIAGGTSEIQRNILAARTLGMGK